MGRPDDEGALMDKDALRRRYTYLWTGETLSSVLFVALLLWLASRDGVWQHWIARSYSLAVVVLILGQGIAWWRLKLRLLDRGQRQAPAPALASFRRWRRINWWLIGAYPLVVVAGALLTGRPLLSFDSWIGLAILSGALLEQINYYYWQLMYDSPYDWAFLRAHRRLRRGSIGKALDGHATA